MKTSRVNFWAVVIAGSVLLAGCAYYRPAQEIDESTEVKIKEGPGLFTGKSGEWVIYNR